MKKLFNNLPEIISGIALVIVLFSVITNVLLRYFFSISIAWAGELSTISFAWLIFVGASACYKRKAHIGIDVLVNMLSEKNKRKIEFIVGIFLVLINTYVFYLSIILAVGAWTKPTPILEIPYTFVNLSLVIGFGLMTIYSIQDLINILSSKNKKDGNNNVPSQA